MIDASNKEESQEQNATESTEQSVSKVEDRQNMV